MSASFPRTSSWWRILTIQQTRVYTKQAINLDISVAVDSSLTFTEAHSNQWAKTLTKAVGRLQHQIHTSRDVHLIVFLTTLSWSQLQANVFCGGSEPTI